jgi:hypothetical protein
MVSSGDLISNKPNSSQLVQVANGEVITTTENSNNDKLLTSLQLVYDWVRDNGLDRTLNNIFSGAINTFNTIKANLIQPAILNGDLSLDPNGTGKVRYLDGSSNTEIASKGFVNGVAFAAGNVPSGGTASTWLEGNGTWSDPRTFTPWEIKTINFTAVDKAQYSINTGLNVQLPPPTATITIVVKPAIGQDFTVTPSTLVRAGSEKIANDAASYTMDINAEYKITSNGTDYDVSIAPIGRV